MELTERERKSIESIYKDRRANKNYYCLFGALMGLVGVGITSFIKFMWGDLGSIFALVIIVLLIVIIGVIHIERQDLLIIKLYDHIQQLEGKEK
jgi:hypothetical protein